MKLRNLFAILISGVILAAALGYAAFWYGLAGQVKTEINNTLRNAAADGFEIYGQPPTVTGFPRPLNIYFSGTVKKDGVDLSIPALELSGFPLPGQIVNITLPQGFSLTGPDINSELSNADYLSFSGPIPFSFPDGLTVEALRAWRDSGGIIDISQFTARKKSLQVDGFGQLKLDGSLQLAGTMEAIIKGHMAFLGYLQSQKLIDERKFLVTGAILNGLSQNDKKNGERFIKAVLTIQDSHLLLGPVQLVRLPMIVWPYADTDKSAL